MKHKKFLNKVVNKLYTFSYIYGSGTKYKTTIF